MRSRVALLGCLLVSSVVFAEEKKVPPRFSVEPYGYYYAIPGFFFETNVENHPRVVDGYMAGIALRYSFLKDRSFSVGVNAFKAEASGTGKWGNQSDFAKYHVDGAVTGSVNWSMIGGGLTLEKYFWNKERLSPVVGLDLGVGRLIAEFKGEFNGINLLTLSKIRGVPANSHTAQLLPVVNLHLGLRYRFTDHLSVVPNGWLGTPGYGLGVKAQFAF